MRSSDRYCLGPTLMRKRSREGRVEREEKEDRGGGRKGGRARMKLGGGK